MTSDGVTTGPRKRVFSFVQSNLVEFRHRTNGGLSRVSRIKLFLVMKTHPLSGTDVLT